MASFDIEPLWSGASPSASNMSFSDTADDAFKRRLLELMIKNKNKMYTDPTKAGGSIVFQENPMTRYEFEQAIDPNMSLSSSTLRWPGYQYARKFGQEDVGGGWGISTLDEPSLSRVATNPSTGEGMTAWGRRITYSNPDVLFYNPVTGEGKELEGGGYDFSGASGPPSTEPTYDEILQHIVGSAPDYTFTAPGKDPKAGQFIAEDPEVYATGELFQDIGWLEKPQIDNNLIIKRLHQMGR